MEKKLTPIFKHLEQQNTLLKWIVAAQCIVVVLALLTNVKPPIVIRETSNGATVIDNYEFDQRVSQLDAELFASTFVRKLNLMDSFSIYENVPAALNMMDKQLRDHYKDNVITKSLIKSVIEQENRSVTEIELVETQKEGDLVTATITYKRTLIGFKSGERQTIVVRGDAIFEIVDRSREFPYGLAVKKYKEVRLS